LSRCIEAAGMEHRLARYMIDRSMAYLAAHADATFHVAINVSLETFRSPLFRTMLAELRAEHDVPAERIILELTERGVGELSGADIETMTRIRMDGFLLSLDDFGVGQSSIQRLVQLPLSEVKIDQMFIRDVTTSEEARRLVESIIAMGQALKIPITAEGIENAETFEMLKGLAAQMPKASFSAGPFRCRSSTMPARFRDKQLALSKPADPRNRYRSRHQRTRHAQQVPQVQHSGTH